MPFYPTDPDKPQYITEITEKLDMNQNRFYIKNGIAYCSTCGNGFDTKTKEEIFKTMP